VSNAIARFRRRRARAAAKVHSLRVESSVDAKARALARRAFDQHQGCVARAHHELSEALAETDASERAVCRVVRSPWPAPRGGAADIVCLAERLGDGRDRIHAEVLVATKQDEYRVSLDGPAAPVSWTTRVADVGRDGAGRVRFVEIYNVTTSELVA
jgi:hypothetical protein